MFSEIRAIPGFSGYNRGSRIECSGGVGTPRSASPEGLVPMNPQDTSTTTEDTTEDEIPYGYCHCGCGQKTVVSTKTDRRQGWTKGEPRRFVDRHGSRAPYSRILRIKDDSAVISAQAPDGKTVEVIVDAVMASALVTFRWTVSKHRDSWYVLAYHNGHAIRLHHAVLEVYGVIVDHWNGNPLDNRRSNLRVATHQQNQQNQVRKNISDAGFRGVSYDPRNRKWRVRCGEVWVGRFSTRIEAAMAYDEAARKINGEFAVLNFPRSGERSALTGEIAA